MKSTLSRIRKSASCALGVLVFAALIGGCLDFRRYYRPGGKLDPPLPEGTRALVLPIQSNDSYPRSYDAGLLTLHEVLRRRLAEAGFEVVPEERARTILRINRHARERLFEGGKARSALARRGNEETAFLSALSDKDVCDIVVISGIAVRAAEYMGQKARWDGVIRKFKIEAPSTRAPEFGVHGTGDGLSLGVRIRNLEGTLLHESIGGINLVHKVVYSQGYGPFRLVATDDALNDRNSLNESVAIALHPFVVHSGYAEDPVFQDR